MLSILQKIISITKQNCTDLQFGNVSHITKIKNWDIWDGISDKLLGQTTILQAPILTEYQQRKFCLTSLSLKISKYITMQTNYTSCTCELASTLGRPDFICCELK